MAGNPDVIGGIKYQKMIIVDSLGNPTNDGTGIEVKVQDQSTEIIDLHLSVLKNAITINVNTAIGQKIVNIKSIGYTPLVGDMACFKEGTAFYQGEITAVASLGSDNYNITLDSPLDYAYTTAGGCSLRNSNLNVNGSVTPVIFSVSPKNLAAGTKWDITRMLFQIVDDTIMDDAKFGGITALTNGIVVRKKDGTYKNIFNIKANSDFALHAFDIAYSDKAPTGSYGFRVRRSFNGFDKNGVVIRLSADTEDELQVIVQDDLTGLTKFEVVAQGHIVEP